MSPRKAKYNLTLEELQALLIEHWGNISKIGRLRNMPYGTVQRYLQRYDLVEFARRKRHELEGELLKKQ